MRDAIASAVAQEGAYTLWVDVLTYKISVSVMFMNGWKDYFSVTWIRRSNT